MEALAGTSFFKGGMLPEKETDVMNYGDIVVVEDNDLVEEAKINTMFYVSFRNDFVTARQDMTLREAKLLRIIISQILTDDSDFRNFKVSITELAKILELSRSSLYRDAKEICENLHKRIISIENPDGSWENISWVSRSRYDNSFIYITLSDGLKPYLLELKNNFTRIRINELVQFNSMYGLRIYECLKCEWEKHYKKKTKFQYDVSTLRKILSIEDKLQKFSHFKERVLVFGKDAINKNTAADFYMDFTCIKGAGNSVKSIVFEVTPRENPNNSLSEADIL